MLALGLGKSEEEGKQTSLVASTLMAGDSTGLSALVLRVTQVVPLPMVFRLTSASPTNRDM